MRLSKWKPYVFFVVFTELVGALSGFLTRNGVKAYETFAKKPALTPPGVMFPIVWGILYLLMGVGAARVWRSTHSFARTRGLILFGAQLAVNFCWSLLFFNAQLYGVAFLWILLLWGLILLMIRVFYQADTTAAYLQIPYLLWVSFASYLNFMVWQLN